MGITPSVSYCRVCIDGVEHPDIVGVMFDKPTPDTIISSLDVPSGSSDPNFRIGQWLRLSGWCASQRPLKPTIAQVIDKKPGRSGGIWYYVIMYPAGRPAEGRAVRWKPRKFDYGYLYDKSAEELDSAIANTESEIEVLATRADSSTTTAIIRRNARRWLAILQAVRRDIS